MKNIFCAFLLGIAATFPRSAIADTPLAPEAPVAASVPVNVIYDTDMMSDIDDALGLAMLHALHERHEANIIAVTISTDDKWCASYVDLVNTFYGQPGIPVGIVHGGVNLRRSYPDDIPAAANYTEVLSERRRADGSLVYPHRIIDGARAPEAVALLRKTLEAQPDHSVVMIQVGFCTNYARLLDSKADAESALDGRALVQKKVRLLSVMAGNFAETHDAGKTYQKGQPEFNLMMDVPSAQKLFSDWPTPIVASGFEVGHQMLFPAFAVDHYFSYVQDHPIAETYRTYVEWGKVKWQLKWPHDHATYDLTAVLFAVRPDAGYFSLSKPGKITVLPGGASRFDESESGSHRYLILPEDRKARTLEALVMLASQPPAECATSMGKECK